MYGNSKKNFFLKELFPTQFDTIPHIILWSVIFFVDVGIVFGAAYLLGLSGNVNDVWWAFIIAEFVSATVCAIFFLKIYKNKVKPLYVQE